MGKFSLPSLRPGSFVCSWPVCGETFSSKNQLFSHITGTHGSGAIRSLSLSCPYCNADIIGKKAFDKHVSKVGDCESLRNSMFTSSDFAPDILTGLEQGHLSIKPVQTGRKSYKLTVVPAKQHEENSLNSEQRMIRHWVECWLKARSRGAKEVDINEMMATATNVAYETGLYSEQTIKTLNSHSSEDGRRRFLQGSDAFVNPKRLEMSGGPAYIFPFSASCSGMCVAARPCS